MHIKKGDKVVLIAGKDKGKSGKILTCIPKTNRVIVEGVNMQTKHKKATRQMQQAGIINQEGTVNASNVMLYCDKCKKGVRVERQITEKTDKSKRKVIRVCKKCSHKFD